MISRGLELFQFPEILKNCVLGGGVCLMQTMVAHQERAWCSQIPSFLSNNSKFHVACSIHLTNNRKSLTVWFMSI